MTVGTDRSGFPTEWDPTVDAAFFNVLSFIIQQALGQNATATLVKVISCTNTGDVSAVGTVVVQPLVKLIDGAGNTSSHGELQALPYFRLYGGKNAVIMDPQKDDIGLAIFADRDISSVVTNQAEANPGSARRFNMADGLYVGGFLGSIPQQYVQFTDDGVNITDKNGNTIVMDSSGITINGVIFDRSQNITNFHEATSQGGVTVTHHSHHQGTDTHGDTEQDVSIPFG
jgi:hypothetical protein